MYQLQWHWPCIFMDTEVISQIMDYNVTLHFTLNQKQANSISTFCRIKIYSINK